MTLEFTDLAAVGQISVELRLVCPLPEIKARVAGSLVRQNRWTELRQRARDGHAKPTGSAREASPIHRIEERGCRGFLARDDEIETRGLTLCLSHPRRWLV